MLIRSSSVVVVVVVLMLLHLFPELSSITRRKFISLIFDAFDDSNFSPRAFARNFRSRDLREESRESECVLIFFGKRIVIVGAAKDIVVAQMDHGSGGRRVLKTGVIEFRLNKAA